MFLFLLLLLHLHFNISNNFTCLFLCVLLHSIPLNFDGMDIYIIAIFKRKKEKKKEGNPPSRILFAHPRAHIYNLYSQFMVNFQNDKLFCDDEAIKMSEGHALQIDSLRISFCDEKRVEFGKFLFISNARGNR